MGHLIFVYNADSGKLNALADSLHKLISPSTYECRLCQITHSWFSEKAEWRSFIDGLGVECSFLHRDEFFRDYGEMNQGFPAVFFFRKGELQVLISKSEFDDLDSITDLSALIKSRIP